MTPLYTVAETRAIENTLFEKTPSYALMQEAGEKVAQAAQTMLADLGIASSAPVLAIAGSGNNGGDAAIAATALRREGWHNTRLLLVGEAAQLPADAARALREWQDSGGDTLTAAELCDSGGAWVLPPAALLIDGIFGIGLSRAPADKWQTLIAAINAHGAPVLAIDIPSGLAADSGSALGGGGHVVRAAQTVTFIGGKPGLYTGDGCDCSGRVTIAPLGEMKDSSSDSYSAGGFLMETAPPLHRLRRRANSHKGSFGTLALVGGSSGMLGALVLAARAAATLGAGKTIAYALQPPPPVDFLRPDVMWRDANALFAQSSTATAATVFAAGMGMGTDEQAKQCLAQLLAQDDTPLLLDADALNLLAQDKAAFCKRLSQRCQRQAATLLTPHPGEAAHLLGCTAAQINENRPAAARALAEEYHATVVLKGAGTIIQPQGAGKPFIICRAGNPGLARGGSGDVLSGMIAALLAQTQDAEFAATAGVWLHAAAADHLAAAQGMLGLDINQLAQTAAQSVKNEID